MGKTNLKYDFDYHEKNYGTASDEERLVNRNKEEIISNHNKLRNIKKLENENLLDKILSVKMDATPEGRETLEAIRGLP